MRPSPDTATRTDRDSEVAWPDAHYRTAVSLAANAPLAAAEAFRVAFLHHGANLAAPLFRAEALAAAGARDDAIRELSATLRRLAVADALHPLHAALGCSPTAPPEFVAAWATADLDAKKGLLTARCHWLRGELSGDTNDLWAAVALVPEWPTVWLRLGEQLLAQNRPIDAVEPLRRALACQSLRADAGQRLDEAYRAVRSLRAARRLARELGGPSDALVGDELASVVIPCWNQASYTRRCVESLVRCTHTPFELILVDNGSTDETPELLAKYANESLPNPHLVRVSVLRNDENRGFAVACNQGLREARGQYLVLLNNDTLATQHWLERLVDWSLINYPRVGLVGPASNRAPDPQFVPFDFVSETALEAFAQRRFDAHGEQAVVVERLTGFCLLLRRDVLDAVGLLDERFGLGFFEDDDLCVRVREKGHELLFAPGVFVHHYGSRTVSTLATPAEMLLRENHAKFAEKWGAELASRYRLPQSPPSDSRLSPPARVSLCMIVKNEEANLGDCLASVADLVDEIVVVDTGSTDRTKEIAGTFNARLFDFPWIDDFAAARNESLRHATGDWIFWMDADDRLDAENRDRFRRLRDRLADGPAAFVMKCRCTSSELGGATVVDHVRLFRNRPGIRWRYRIHEQILPAIRAQGGDVAWTDVVVRHVGYVDADLYRRKGERDLRLLLLENADRPDDPFTLFNLGTIRNDLGQFDEAVHCLRRSLALSQPQDSIVRKIYSLLAQALRHLGRLDEALASCAEGLGHFPDDPELNYCEGLVRKDCGELDAAEASFRRVRAMPTPTGFFSSSDAGLRSHKALHNLAVINRERKRYAEAERHWRDAVAECPDFVPAWCGLAELHLAAKRWPEFESCVANLRPRDPLEAAVLSARRDLAERRFDSARTALESLCAAHPTALPPRLFLSHVLLQSNAPHPDCERALRAILALAPNHPEATNNLEVLLAARARNR